MWELKGTFTTGVRVFPVALLFFGKSDALVEHSVSILNALLISCCFLTFNTSCYIDLKQNIQSNKLFKLSGAHKLPSPCFMNTNVSAEMRMC